MIAGDVGRGHAKLAHQGRNAPLGIVGQDANRVAVILDLALDVCAVGEPNPCQAEPTPVLVQEADAQDLSLYARLATGTNLGREEHIGRLGCSRTVKPQPLACRTRFAASIATASTAAMAFSSYAI